MSAWEAMAWGVLVVACMVAVVAAIAIAVIDIELKRRGIK